jgi:aminoglycoside phosphotransferase (APT) family kinase protein
VPRPIRGSWQLEHWDGPPFSYATGLDGTPLSVEDGARAAPALAAFLRLLHEQRIEGYGPLDADDGRLRGRESSMAAGLEAWAGRPLWPLGDARLDIHPALAERRTLSVRLDARAPAVRLALTEGRGVPLHSDLHEENILDAGGALGIIDFGQALIGPAAWDFAALAYFLGWPTADATLAAYARDAAELSSLRADATAIGLCFGVFRWAQDRERGIDEDAHDEAFLLETLSRR